MPGLDGIQLTFVNNVDQAHELMRWLGERHDGILSVDTETEGLDAEVCKVRLAQIGDSRRGWAIPFERWGGVFEEALSKLHNEELCGHNVKFEVAMLGVRGVDLRKHRLHDTRLMAHVLHPHHSTALKRLAARYVDPRAGALQSDLGLSHAEGGGQGSAGWTWATVPVDYEPYWTYGAMDPVLTSQLHSVLEPLVREQGAWRAYELELAASLVCEKMERNGVPIDVAYAQEKLADFSAQARGLSDACLAAYGCRPGQDAKLREVLLGEGIELTKMTPGGEYSLDKEVLGDLDHPLVDLVLQYRRLTKLSSTYLRHFDSERQHPRINSVGARTGRMSMDHMNFQNLPRKADASAEAIEVRNCVRAREGHTLLFADFDQIELRLMAHVCWLLGYTELHEAFASPEDFFVVVARQVFNEPGFQKSDLRRTIVKNFVYGGNYGAGVPKLALTAGISLEQAELVDQGLKTAFPGIKAFHRKVEEQAIRRAMAEGHGYVTSFLTGRRHPADDNVYYTLVNYLLQGTAAEVFKLKLIELDNLGLSDYLILPVHDEAIMEVPTEDLPEIARTVHSAMNDTSLLSLPITAGLSTAERWGQKTDYHLEET